MENDRKRLCANERAALLHLCAALQAITAASDLDARVASIKGAKAMVNGAKGMLGKVLDMIFDTMPLEQLVSFRRNLKGLRYSLNVQNVAGKDYKNDGCWLSLDALDELCGATKEHCLVCVKSIEEQRRCPLAKALDELPCINADVDAHGCRYFGGI